MEKTTWSEAFREAKKIPINKLDFHARLATLIKEIEETSDPTFRAGMAYALKILKGEKE